MWLRPKTGMRIIVINEPGQAINLFTLRRNAQYKDGWDLINGWNYRDSQSIEDSYYHLVLKNGRPSGRNTALVSTLLNSNKAIYWRPAGFDPKIIDPWAVECECGRLIDPDSNDYLCERCKESSI